MRSNLLIFNVCSDDMSLNNSFAAVKRSLIIKCLFPALCVKMDMLICCYKVCVHFEMGAAGWVYLWACWGEGRSCGGEVLWGGLGGRGCVCEPVFVC